MSEMGEWLAQMFANGTISRPSTYGAGTSAPGGMPYVGTEASSPAAGPGMSGSAYAPAGGMPYLGTEAAGSGMPVGPDGKGDPSQHMFTRPGGEGPFPPPGGPAYPGAPPWAGDPNIPAPLANFLMQYESGYPVLPQEIYDLYGGDAILEAMRRFDPNAQWSRQDLYGGEGGGAGQGYRLDYDRSKLPAGAGPGWMSPVNMNPDRLRNGEMKYYDPNYGWVTDPRNVYHKSEGIEKWAPAIAALISMGGPALGAAAAGAGIGAGVGGTSAVTGSAAGLVPANIPAAGASSWWTNLLGKAPRTVGPLLSGAPSAPTLNPRPVVPAGAVSPGAPAARRGMPVPRNATVPDPYGFDATRFNAGGSAPNPRSNDSKLVATDFADDPYRFS